MLVPRRSPQPVPKVVRFDPRADLLAAARPGHEGALVALAVAVAVIVSSLWLPSLGWASATFPPAGKAVVEGKGPRLGASGVDGACAGEIWGAESRACVAAMFQAAGREPPATLRIIGPAGS